VLIVLMLLAVASRWKLPAGTYFSRNVLRDAHGIRKLRGLFDCLLPDEIRYGNVPCNADPLFEPGLCQLDQAVSIEGVQ
jgi:hypothetical protein